MTTEQPTPMDTKTDPQPRANTAKKTDAEKSTVQVEPRSGYRWEREEDAPGYAWGSKRAQDEYMRARESIVQEGLVVGRQYGDVALIAGEDTPWEKVV